MDHLLELLRQIQAHPLPSLLVVLNLVLVESLLSVDNAAVLATMVLDLPKSQRRRALRYGILGAYVFRGISLLFASMLVRIWWFKPIGGLYLLILAFRYFFKRKPEHEEAVIEKSDNWFYRRTICLLGPFWSTVVLVELMDMAFSIDNVVAATAYTKNLILIWTGVFIGILAMRFVAGAFVKLMERFRFLELCAYTVIALLGLKLTASMYTHFNPCAPLAIWLDGDLECLHHRGIEPPEGYHPRVWGDLIVSIGSIALFAVPVLTSYFFGWPARSKRKER
jgi:YkoY family integral membrane protein